MTTTTLKTLSVATAVMLTVSSLGGLTGSAAAPYGGARALSAVQRGTVTIEEPPVPLADRSSTARYPSAPGTSTSGNSLVTIDSSNMGEGYVMIQYSGSASKVKVQITKAGRTTYTYDLNTGGKFEVFPLTNGDGSYTINVYENVYSNQYALGYGTTLEVTLNSSTLPFLYPSQYVNYNAQSNTVKKGAELAGSADSELALVSKIYNYCIQNITYDYNKAATIKSGYLPVVDTILSTGTGICFDYAAVMTAMLRSQNIPTQLHVGYVSGGIYHAWINTYITDVGWVNNIIYFDGKSWKMMDPTFASSGGQSSEIMAFIGNGTNYSVQYIY
ncbi:transglutaminase-like domain-containing protein [Oscillospiraceae bacterium MB08-C2-2]|nr:transglutaminase-like domain-containing protein [Oscillospiraceae bacterium MB08-C2-2]